ncbi:MAG TPA: RHS repeat-associated core domain-containing protein [Pyrinomonadaceae bacterium]|nr:RHS repeat-associated core domain-containing protein [Pyrinomonadaceae bacterium]
MMRIVNIANGLIFTRSRSDRNRRRPGGFSGSVRAITHMSGRTLSLILICSMLATSTPAAPQTIVSVARECHSTLAFWLRANDLPASLARVFSGQNKKARPQEKQEERDARVARLQIYPGDTTIGVDGRISFAAVAYDFNDASVGGVEISWRVHDVNGQAGAVISSNGQFEGKAPGRFKVIAEAAGQIAQATVMVLPTPGGPNPNDVPLRTRRVSSRDLPSQPSAETTNPDNSSESAKPSAGSSNQGSPAQWAKGGRTRRGRQLRAHAVPIDSDGGWGDSNYTSADDPGNGRGDPPGHPIDGGAGSGNFQLKAPLVGLPGRGIDISLGLSYNSRVWNKAGNVINFDIDRDWPAPGWSLGFGKILDLGAGGSMLVDADGTRHSFTGDLGPPTSGGQDFVGHTTDGTLIQYKTWKNVSGVMTFGEANLPNGSQIHYYGVGPGGVFPTDIVDANGNLVIITYVTGTGRIQTITDTLGRVISFFYDSHNNLTAITTPRLGVGTGDRTLVRLTYHQISLNSSSYSFGLTPVVRDPNPWLIDAIYYPGTGTGYWFGDTDSYSTYGMLAKSVEMRGMTFSGPDPIPAYQGPTEQGTITAGQMTLKAVYNYPLYVGDNSGTASTNLTDAPTYTSMTETWTRDGNPANIDSATTNFLVVENVTGPPQPVTTRKVEVTLPNSTKSIQYSYNYTSLPPTDSRKALDGLVYQDETRDSAGTLLQRSTATWEEGSFDSPRPIRIEATNERSQTTATTFTYGSNYNQVIDVRNYDYGGTVLLRSTRTEYQNSANYTGARHIFNLPLSVDVFGPDNTTRVSHTEYQYDGQTLENAPGVIGHSPNHNPYSPSYNSITAYRGNVTQITTYAEAIGPSLPVGESRRYDITGNLIKTSTSCCEQITFSYTSDTRYGFPLSKTSGSSTDPYAQVTTSATYDFSTGLPLSSVDANGRTSQTSYFSEMLRPQTSSLPSGAHTDYAYDDTAMSVTETTYLETHPTHTTIAGQNVKLLNGRGQVRQEKALGENSVWDFVDTIYDSMGRVAQQSRPYRSGDTPLFTSVAYDALGRTTRMTAADGSVTETYYNEIDFDSNDGYSPTRPNVVGASTPGETTLVRDAWGRERWGRSDAQRRLVEVVEPDPSGNGAVATGGLITTYSYNTLGNLTGVAQGAQTRTFKYDSLGRLLAQKLAETNATLSDAGLYQTSGGTWSDVFTYDNRSNLTSRTDARGVKTVYNYANDPLNRLQSVSWDTSGFGDTTNPIFSAATVSYQYRTKSSSSQLRDITQLSSVTTSGVSTESYDFDSEHRVFFKRLVVNGRPAMDTNYSFDNLDRITDIYYPAKDFSAPQTSRQHVHQDYDVASRLSNLTVDGATHASQIVYNAASQTTSLKVGVSGANQITENYGYHAQTGLLDTQTVTRGATALLNLSYEYANGNGKRTGQLMKIHNNLNPGKDRGYAYDALGRLTQATGGQASAPIWTQTYSYDRYGNRTNVSASGYSANNRINRPSVKEGLAQNAKSQGPDLLAGASAVSDSASSDEPSAPIAPPAEPHVSLPTEQIAADTEIKLPDSLRAGAARSTAKSHHASRTLPPGPPAPADPPVFTNPDLLAPGGVQVKALHITELRTAINDLRAQLGLSAFSWQTSAVSGGSITADPILEMRTALDQALGAPPAPGYLAGLAQGQPIKAFHIQELRNRVLAAWNGGASSCPPGQTLLIDQFVKNFYQGALARQPNGNELQAWSSQLRQAYYQGQTQLLAAAQYLGRQIFRSTEYVNRNRDNHSYVYDLYWAYLQRQPDQGGWDYWTGQAGLANGRENVRHAFEDAGDAEFVAKLASLCPSFAGAVPIPRDGLATVSYDAATNRITTGGFQYDAAGNQTRTVRADGSAQRFKYDAANRLIQVLDDYGYVLVTNTYGASNERLIADEGGLRTYYACNASMEYVESGSSTTPQWSKSSVYLGARLLSTLTPNGSGGQAVQYHHPDRLGTRLVTNAQDSTYFEQVSLPFGTALDSESTGSTKRRFTSYDRSSVTGLDYANNRHYDSQQGRFTQVDPIGMSGSSLSNPQSLNMYSYVGNDPVNRTDPSGLFWGKLFGFFKKLVKIVMVALAVALIIVAIVNIGNPLVSAGAIWGAFALAGLLLAAALGPKWLRQAISLAGAAAAIHIRRPGPIWNFTNSDTPNRIGSLLAGVGPLTLFLQELPKPKPEPAPEGSSAGKRLSPCVKNRLRPYFPGLDLDKIRIFEGIPAYVIGNNRAYTEGNNIFFGKSQFDPYSAEGIGLIGHETTHVQQYSRGVIRFVASYGGQYGHGRWIGLDHDAAYENISFELAAEKMGQLIEKDLNNMMRQAGGNSPCPR